MAKSSSSRKVARAARSGGGRRARQTGDRSPLFLGAMAAVVVIGILLVIWARSERDQSDDPVIDRADTLRAAYGVYDCDAFAANLPVDNDVDTSAGVVTFGDGLMYLPPEQAGQATLGDFFEEAGVELSDDRLDMPGRALVEGETECSDGVTGELRVLSWPSLDATEPEVTTEDLAGVVLTGEGQLITVAFVPPDTADADVPRPASEGALAAALGVDAPTSPTTTATTAAPGATPSSTAAGGASPTSATPSSTAAPTTTAG
jgi:hypothetical protein